VHQPLCIDYPNGTLGIHELSTKTYIKWVNKTSHCHHRYSIARHTSSVLKSNIQSNITTLQRARLNSSQEGRGGETPYDLTIVTKLVVHQDRAKSRTQERDQTHSYWYIPSAPRVNYSLLVMETIRMMNMATGDGFPLRQGAGTGSRLVFRGYRGLRRWNFRCRFLFGVSVFIGVFGVGLMSGGVHEAAASQGARPHPVVASGLLFGIFSLQYFIYFPKIFSVNF
jgi:hypothetical protein